MAVSDLRPEGFSEEMAWYAKTSRSVRVYPQHFGSSVALWLDVDGTQTMIGYGTPDAAIAEARAALDALAESIRPKVEELLNRT